MLEDYENIRFTLSQITIVYFPLSVNGNCCYKNVSLCIFMYLKKWEGIIKRAIKQYYSFHFTFYFRGENCRKIEILLFFA